jgi:hypothetical protein
VNFKKDSLEGQIHGRSECIIKIAGIAVKAVPVIFAGIDIWLSFPDYNDTIDQLKLSQK